MSGKKHHFIPQFVIKSFSFPTDNRYDNVYVYKRNKGKFRVPTTGIGAEKYFYETDPKNPDFELDNIVTKEESFLAKTYSELRIIPAGLVPEKYDIARILTHLCIRVSHVRESFSSAFIDVALKTSEALSNPASLRKLMKLDDPMPARPVLDALRDQWQIHKKEITQKGHKQKDFERTMLRYLRENFDKHDTLFNAIGSSMLSSIKLHASNMIRTGHIKTLNKSLAPEPRVEQLRRFDWYIIDIGENEAILPDCIAIAIDQDDSVLPLVFSSFSTIRTVIWPISHYRVIVGGPFFSDIIEKERLASDCARNCWDFFISRREDEGLDQLIPHIGEDIREFLQRSVRP